MLGLRDQELKQPHNHKVRKSVFAVLFNECRALTTASSHCEHRRSCRIIRQVSGRNATSSDAGVSSSFVCLLN